MPGDLQSIVQRMIDAGESEDNIATVIQHFKSQQSPTPFQQADAAAAREQARTAAMQPHMPDAVQTLKAFGRSLLPSDTPSDYIDGPMYAIQHPIDSMRLLGGAIIGSHVDQAKKAYQAATKGRSVEALGHTAAAAFPVIGPAAAHAGERIANGDIEGGLGEGAALVAPSIANDLTRPVGRVLIDQAVRPAPTLAEEFPNIADTMIDERLKVGRVAPFTQSGSQQAKGVLRSAARDTRQTLAAADAAGYRANPAAVIRDPMIDARADIAKQPLSSQDAQTLTSYENQFLAEHPNDLTPTALKDMKQGAQAVAKPIYKAQRAGSYVPAAESVNARFNDAVARGTRSALENLPEYGPTIAEQEGRTQDLIGATRAIRRAETRRLPLMAELAAPLVGVATGTQGGFLEGLGSALATRALLSPRTLSRAGLAVTTPGLPAMLRAAILSRMLGGEGDQQIPPATP